MIKRLILGTTMCLISGLSFATWEGSVDSYEVSSKQLQLPASISGSVILKPCPSCASKTHRVSSQTKYRISNREVTLENFRSALRAANARGERIVVVGYDINTQYATSIAL